MAPTREVLRESGIVIEEDALRISVMPQDGKDLRDMLLNFWQIVPYNVVSTPPDCTVVQSLMFSDRKAIWRSSGEWTTIRPH